MESGQELGTQWQYGKLASLAYQLDKPIGTSFGDVELYQELLSGVTGEVLEPAVGTGRMLTPLLEGASVGLPHGGRHEEPGRARGGHRGGPEAAGRLRGQLHRC